MYLFFTQSLILFSFFFALSFFYFFFSKNSSSSNNQKSLRNYPLVGTLPEFIKNRHRFLEWMTDVLSSSPNNTITFRRPGNVKGIITANPSNVEHMLKTKFHNYPKGSRFIFLLQDFLGSGIFNSDAHLWKIQRKTASFEFNTRSLRNFIIDNVRQELQSRLIPLLNNSATHDGTHQAIDLQDVLERFAFDNVCKLAFNEDPACLCGDGTAGGDFMRAFEDAATLSAGRFMYAVPLLWRVKKCFNVGSEKRLRESIKTVHEFADRIIRSRLEEKVDVDEDEEADLLSRFIASDHNSPEFLRDIVISFILAGRDTTSSALSWFFWILASRPDVERCILDELEAIRRRNGKRIGDTYDLEELREMNYLHAAVSETMRLYPPVPVDSKACEEDDVMPDGTFVGKGWFASYNTYSMGRLESIWGNDCREFVPERWLENGTFRAESAYRFPVFHAGPRMCLGKDMAYIQMKSIAASVIEQFEVEALDKDTCPQYLLSLTLRIKGGLMVRVKKRVLREFND